MHSKCTIFQISQIFRGDPSQERIKMQFLTTLINFTIVFHNTRVILQKSPNSQYILSETHFFHKFSVVKMCIYYLKMHSDCTILMQIPPPIPVGDPRPQSGRGGDWMA